MQTPTLPAPEDVLLSDGTIGCIRPMIPSDEAGLLALHDSMTDHSVRMRFFAANRKTGRDYVRHLVEGTGDTVLTLVVLVDDVLVGEATAERVSPDTAEVALLVADEMHGHGVGTLLLERLAAACRERGVETFVAEVLSENAEMLKVIDDLGVPVTRHAADGVVSIELRTAPDARDAPDAPDATSADGSATHDPDAAPAAAMPEDDPSGPDHRWAHTFKH